MCTTFISVCDWICKYPVWMSVCNGGGREVRETYWVNAAMVMERSDVEQLSVKLTCVLHAPSEPLFCGEEQMR